MTQAIQKQQDGATALEQVLLNGDLSQLTAEQRIQYYKATCESLGLNPLTKPFDYIKLNNKLTLYAKKDATDQLRKLRGVSIDKPDIQQIDNLIIVTVMAVDKDGRKDSDIGVVGKGDMGGNIGNALMKAVTKAKRRVTLSICGLGMLDETEVETIPDAVQVNEPSPAEVRFSERLNVVGELCQLLNGAKDSIKWTPKKLSEYANDLFGINGGINAISLDQLETLIEDLEQRLATLETEPETEQ